MEGHKRSRCVGPWHFIPNFLEWGHGGRWVEAGDRSRGMSEAGPGVGEE